MDFYMNKITPLSNDAISSHNRLLELDVGWKRKVNQISSAYPLVTKAVLLASAIGLFCTEVSSLAHANTAFWIAVPQITVLTLCPILLLAWLNEIQYEVGSVDMKKITPLLPEGGLVNKPNQKIEELNFYSEQEHIIKEMLVDIHAMKRPVMNVDHDMALAWININRPELIDEFKTLQKEKDKHLFEHVKHNAKP
jgi:hypothetical protein